LSVIWEINTVAFLRLVLILFFFERQLSVKNGFLDIKMDEMVQNKIKPGIIVYTCLIQKCLRSKRFDQAINLFEALKHDNLQPDHVLYNTIVNGCLFNQKWDN